MQRIITKLEEARKKACEETMEEFGTKEINIDGEKFMCYIKRDRTINAFKEIGVCDFLIDCSRVGD